MTSPPLFLREKGRKEGAVRVYRRCEGCVGHVGAQRCAPTLLCLLSDQPILVLDLPSPLRAARFRLTLSIRALSIRLLLPITILLLLWPAHVRLQMSERSP